MTPHTCKLLTGALCFSLVWSGVQTSALAADKIKWTKVDIKKSKEKSYTVDVSHPRFTGQPQASLDVLNKQVARDANDTIMFAVRDFVKNPSPSPDLPPSSLEGSFEVPTASNNAVAVNMTYSQMNAGAAHPAHWQKTFNLQLKPPKILKLSDIFRPGSDYLKVLSKYCRKELAAKKDVMDYSDKDWLAKGTAPDANNYKTFLVHDKSLEIIFDEYQVAAYVAGPQSIEVPLKEIESVVNPACTVFKSANPSFRVKLEPK